MEKDNSKHSSRYSKWRFGKKADTVQIEKGLSDSSDSDENQVKRPRVSIDDSSGGSASGGEAQDLRNAGDSDENIDMSSTDAIEYSAVQDASESRTDSGSNSDQNSESDSQSDEPWGLDLGENDSLSSSDGVDDTGSNKNDTSEYDSDSDSSGITSDQEENGNQPQQQHLYDGAPITLYESIMMILSFAFRYSLTGVCIADLLQLICLHCPQNNVCVQSLYKLKKFFSQVGKEILVFHYFCSQCLGLLDSRTTVCTNCDSNPEKLYLIEVPLLYQLRTVFKRSGFYEDLQYRFTRTKKNVNNIEDIYDGNIYKFHVENRFLSNPQNISFMWYTDGVSVYKCSKFSIWPLYFVINELSYKKRTKKENVILAGMWFGKIKPKANTFLTPIHSSLNFFEKHGYSLELPNGENILVKGKVICGTCDLPARSLFLRMKQFNGFYGCSRCKQRGESLKLGQNTLHVYPFTDNIDKRSDEEYETLARTAVASGSACVGVKGPSVLFYMVSKIFSSTGIDSMHCVFSGLAKQLLRLLFDSSYSTSDFSLRSFVNVVNERMKVIRPPKFLPRMPQCVDDLSNWKSLDYKIWFFYYSIPTLLGVMKEDYLNHFMKVISAVFLCSSESISHSQINRAKSLLTEYVKDFETLYGRRHMTMNVHQLLHLPDVVLDLGPLWAYSCYFLEDLNGQIVKLCHGTRYAALQISSSVCLLFNLSPSVRTLNADTPVRQFCEKLNKVTKRYKILEQISPGIELIGTLTHLTAVPRQIQESLFQCLNLRDGHCQLFYRFMKRGIMFYSESYARQMQTQSSFVSFTSDNERCIGKITQFLRRSACNCNVRCLCQPAEFICLIQVYEKIAWETHYVESVNLPYMSKVVSTNREIAIRISDLQDVCFYIQFDDCKYIIERVNRLETE